MVEFTVEHKGAFWLTGYGQTIGSNFQDHAAMRLEKSQFWDGLKQDGRFDRLKQAAIDGREWSVNEVYQGKPWNYFAVETKQEIEDASRLIPFPDSDYIVIAGTGDKEALFDQLTYQAFGEVLPQNQDYAYVGGPNATYRLEQADGSYYGEFWVPVVKK